MPRLRQSLAAGGVTSEKLTEPFDPDQVPAPAAWIEQHRFQSGSTCPLVIVLDIIADQHDLLRPKPNSSA